MKVLTAAQMNEIDRLTSEICGVPSLTLMENAGFHLYLALRDRFSDLSTRNIAIFCGKGNNGGDGFVLARQLAQRGTRPDVFLFGKVADARGDAAVNLQILLKSGVPVFEIESEEAWTDVTQRLEIYDIVVDALLGTGITKPLSGLYERAVTDLNQLDCFVLAVDIPSGMMADSVEAAPLSIWADLTVTFTAPKIAQVLSPDVDAVGELEVVPIGTPPSLLDRDEFRLHLLRPDPFDPLCRPRNRSSHKGTYGHVAVIAGSPGKSGAACLASHAALRTGSGLVTAWVPAPVQAIVAACHAEIMTEACPATAGGTFSAEAVKPLISALEQLDAAGIGPGITTEGEALTFARSVVQKSPVPLVIDADGLNAFVDAVEELRNDSGQPLVLTPHPGEFARLVQRPIPEVLKHQLELVPELAVRLGVWIALKTFRPLISDPAGVLFVSDRGNPGMATGGMGDVLTGIITSLVGRATAAGAESAEDVTRAVGLAVYLHGLAGELAAEKRGEDALLAGDVIESLGAAWESVRLGSR